MIFVDANVVLEILLGRKNADTCNNFLTSATQELAISTLTVHITMYYADRFKISFANAENFLRIFTWLPVTERDAEWAFANYKSSDFEDGLQVSCAVREKCATFVTKDRKLAKKYAQYQSFHLIT